MNNKIIMMNNKEDDVKEKLFKSLKKKDIKII